MEYKLKDLKVIGLMLGIFIALIVTANVTAFKLVKIANFILPAAVFAYAFTFTITDVISEIYGRKVANIFVITGFIAEFFYLLFVGIAWILPPLMPEMQATFAKVFSISARVILASLIAFIVSQTHDIFAYEFWGKKTKGKYLWLRNNASTMISQLIDTVLFITIAFLGLPLNQILNMIVSQYLFKVGIALFDTPLVYLMTYYLKKITNRKTVFE